MFRCSIVWGSTRGAQSAGRSTHTYCPSMSEQFPLGKHRSPTKRGPVSGSGSRKRLTLLTSRSSLLSLWHSIASNVKSDWLKFWCVQWRPLDGISRIIRTGVAFGYLESTSQLNSLERQNTELFSGVSGRTLQNYKQFSLSLKVFLDFKALMNLIWCINL